MQVPDLNLIVALDVLLSEGNVTRAAKRLGLSQSAMSRTLSRLRETTGDPLLVRAGRGLVPTPRAIELREQASRLVAETVAALRPQKAMDVRNLSRTFTIRGREDFVESFGARLVAHVAAEAPEVRLRFVPKTDKDSGPLRDGSIDMETGVVGPSVGPELRAQALYRDRFVGIVRRGHRLLSEAVSPARYAAERHVLVSRRGRDGGPVDEALGQLGLERNVVAIVGSFAEAVALARGSDLVASLPQRSAGNPDSGFGMFEIPLTLPELTISLLWHPRMDADPAHRWLRGCVRTVCAD